ncbi:aspartate/glutamate racemase family protein [Desulfovibrio sp. OttesenSCG-928-G15]|nr:aspartate/glutamate racemase family protein [Desulfovibrio sp. OttesenSCG-928-G15]
MSYQSGLLYYDTPIGVLCLDSAIPKPPGHVRNPLSFRFPTVCHVLQGIDIAGMLFSPSPDMLAPFVSGAKTLEKQGVRAIVGSCGFMALFQKELSESVRIPIISSSLVQLGLVRLLHGPSARTGVLTASAKALTKAHFAAVGQEMEDYPIMGMDSDPYFSAVILEQTEPTMVLERMEACICRAAKQFCTENRLDALLLECTDLSAFGRAIQKDIGIPVYDINSLVEYTAFSVCRPSYSPGGPFGGAWHTAP